MVECLSRLALCSAGTKGSEKADLEIWNSGTACNGESIGVVGHRHQRVRTDKAVKVVLAIGDHLQQGQMPVVLV